MFQGLFLYEIVLMIGGIILFLVSLFILMRSTLQNKKTGSPLLYFVIAIVMIGWPSITSVSFGKGVTVVKNATEEVQANPSSPAAQAKLKQSLANLNTSRADKDPEALHIISNAYAALHNDSARIFEEKRNTILFNRNAYHPAH